MIVTVQKTEEGFDRGHFSFAGGSRKSALVQFCQVPLQVGESDLSDPDDVSMLQELEQVVQIVEIFHPGAGCKIPGGHKNVAVLV
jgi:hypothetical protein